MRRKGRRQHRENYAKESDPEPLDPDPVNANRIKKSKKDNGMTDLEKKINDDKPMNNTGSEADPEQGKPMVDPQPEEAGFQKTRNHRRDDRRG